MKLGQEETDPCRWQVPPEHTWSCQRDPESGTPQELWVGCLCASGVDDGTKKAGGHALFAATWLALDGFVWMHTQLF